MKNSPTKTEIVSTVEQSRNLYIAGEPEQALILALEATDMMFVEINRLEAEVEKFRALQALLDKLSKED